MEATKNRLRLSERRFTLDPSSVFISPADIPLNRFTDSISAPGGYLNRTDLTNDAKRDFARRESVYCYLRPRRNLLAACAWICRKHHMLAKWKPPVIQPGGAKTRVAKRCLSGWASALHIVGTGISVPATLSEALIRLHLVYPLASFDVSGQWPVYFAAAWPNEDYSNCTVVIHPPNGGCQE